MSKEKKNTKIIEEEDKLWKRSLNFKYTQYILLSLMCIRTLSSFLSPISDCDETFNYWEPVHYLLYGYGFQTWEYSPKYALRSYLYLWIHAIFGKFAILNGILKIGVFFFIRSMLGILSSLCETFFLNCVYDRFGKRTTILTYLFLISSSGMFIAVPSFVPSSFSMYMLTIVFGSLMITETSISVIIGWPFSSASIIPAALISIIGFGFFNSLRVASFISSILIGITIYVDKIYYKKVFFTPGNLVMYNKSEGSELYGTESWNFYFLNLTINFGLIFWIGLLLPLIIIITKRSIKSLKVLIYVLPFYLWLGFFSSLPHKEERFIFIIYPLICLSCSISIDYIIKYFNNSTFIKFLTRILTIIIILFGISRSYSIFLNYYSPISSFMYLSNHLTSNKDLVKEQYNICIGKEWYRFPSNFFLPEEKFKLRFLKSDFNGQLPDYFQKGVNGTSVIPLNFNDKNKEEMDRYIEPKDCDFIVDFNKFNQNEERFINDKENWKVIHKSKFLDTEISPKFIRSFYIPTFTEKMNKYNDYYIVKKIDKF